uniref:Myb-like domain-containing protein n=1 Tax=Culex tarsalis TaxID=7177 RepID=A0A1Q3F2G0_CULTA
MSSEKKSRRSNTRSRVTPTPVAVAAEKDSSSDELVIDFPMAPEPDAAKQVVTRAASSTPKASPEKRPAPSTRKKRRRPRSSSSSATEDLEDQTFEETIERCATKNNLTPECVKKLLKKLVMNEHVLAIVKLKEEEEEKTQDKRSAKDGTEGDDEDDEPKSLQPKLTRLKAKQLNKQPLPIVPLKTPLPDEEVAALIREELGSDDDDEEYKPTEEDIHSDEDPNTTISDIDSQPRTPAAPTTPGRIEQDTGQDALLYSKDGVFKIPRFRNDSHGSQQSEQEQENIARRTRSKLCLQTTAIETIESTFIPPDITTDMYDFDCDMDLVWKEFLNEFTKPLPNHAEDDDDTDPEYVAADKIPIDREELREVKVSKKELNELVSELIEMSGIIDESFLDNTLAAPSCDDVPQKDADLQNRKSGLNTPVPKEQEDQQQSSSAVSSVDNASFQPTNSSTPTATVQAVSRVPVVAAQAIQFPNSFATVDNTPVVAAIQPLAVVPPVQSVYPSSYQRVPTNGQFFIQVSTPDKSSYHPYVLPSDKVPVVPIDETSNLYHNYRRYRYLQNVHPVQVQFPEGQTGFTDFQLQILQQQLRIHTQFAAQNFMQCHAHPKFWQMANTFKKMLTDLKDVPNASVRPWNLDLALECCLSWETELDKPSDENKQFIKYLIEEADKSENESNNHNYHERRTFHPKLMEKVVTCKAFMYPNLLPCTPFRSKATIKKRITAAEERLIAFGLELFFDILKGEQNKWLRRVQEKPPSLKQVCGYISKYLCPNYSEDHIYDYCTRHRKYSYLNPIKYYFLHSKAPPYQHVLEKVDLKNVIPPASYQKDELPIKWGKYVYSNERLAKLNGFPKESTLALKPLPASARKHLLPAKDSNVNITISVILDPKQQQQVTQPQQQKSSVDAEVDGSTFQINQQFLDQSYHPVKATPAQPSSLASYVSKFRQDSSQESIEVVELDGAENHSNVCPRTENSLLSCSGRKCCGCDCHGSAPRLGEDCSGSSPQTLLKGQKRLTEYFQRTPRKKEAEEEVGTGSLKEKLWRVYSQFRDLHGTRTDLRVKELKKVQRHCELIASFSYFLEDLKTMSANHVAKNPGDSAMLTNGVGCKFMKVEHSEEKDANYAYNFFEKVEETLLAENKHAQYEQFLEILQTFNEKEDRVADLYRKFEDLFLGEHPELCDLFLTFLLPGQAAEVGKFFEHFILTNANDFLAKLNVYFAKQPSQIKKIYSSLNDLSNEPNVSMEQIKARILPLLKGNPFLIEWFIQLFPQEKPPESNNLSDYETISMKKLPLPHQTNPNEIYEDVPFVELSPEPTTSESTVCGTKYIQGRIVFGTLPARLSFLASRTAAPPSEDVPPLKGCVHAVRSGDKSRAAGGAGGTEEEKDATVDVPADDEQPRYKLCDDAAFKAHAIRLNPLVHGGKGVHFADVAHLLVPEPETAGESNPPDEDKPTSPKKQQQSKSTLPKKRINSPVSKKPGTAGKGSPTNTKKTPATAAASIPADSKVISVSKKLKSMVEAPSNSSEACSESSVPAKRKPSTTTNYTVPAVPVKKEKSLKKHPSDEQLEASEQEQQAEPKEQQPQQVAEEPSWTRDEDKVILEEIKNGYSSVEELIERIGARIEGRSEGQIRTRYEFLMEVLKKFQKTS